MADYTIKRTVEFSPTPRELAEVFASFPSDKQADFFSWLATIISKWGRHFVFQLAWVADEDALTQGGRDIMRLIGEYGEMK